MNTRQPAPWPEAYLRRFVPREHYRFVALTWGTRGDVQPFVALGAELARRGHRVTLAARAPFQAFIEQYGLDFHPLEEDGTEQLMQELASASAGLAGVKLFLKWQRQLIGPQFRQFWEASREADVLISNAAYTLPALHVAESRGLPIVQAFFDPVFLPTRSYGLFDEHLQDRGALRNLLSTRLRNIATAALTADVVGTWRRRQGLSWLRLGELHAPAHVFRMPVFAAWSTALLPRPGDWPEPVVQTGRWHWPVEERVSPSLRQFMEAGPAPVYIGFGSWGTHDKTAVTELILQALRRTGNRGVLHRNTVDGRTSFPEDVHVDDNLPHEWLFPQVKAVVHHGGAGTTGAVATAGVPSVIVPAFFGQVPWGGIVRQRGVGTMLARSALSADSLAEALREVGQPQVREQARALGQRAKAEGGVTRAADEIERRLREAAAAQARGGRATPGR
jgi:sterol 3beta-glucosyltransferase